MVIINFSSAFDCINFDLLVDALRACGVSDHACKWFSSYLHGKTQCTKYCGSLSTSLSVSSEVPQGSIPGPILFNIFINQLLKLLPCDSAVAYADDNTLVCSSDSIAFVQQSMQILLDFVREWSLSLQLSINISKCFAL